MSDHDSGDDQATLNKNNAINGEEELASRTLQIQSKRFYLDVKQNRRGRFIKIAEVGSGGKKSRLLFAMSTAAEFRDKLTEFNDHYISLGSANTTGANVTKMTEDGKLKSDLLSKDNRRYYLDLKENQRGRFLRVSMTVPLSRQRAQVAIPAQGMIEIRDSLTDLLTQYGTDDFEVDEDLPEPQSLKTDNKIFYFDIGQNRRGRFMRISEVRTNFRTAVTIPEKSWARFRDVMSEFADKGASGDSKVEAKKEIKEEIPVEVGASGEKN